MMHGRAADSLQPLTVKAADSVCQELIKQQGNKSQAPKPSLEGRLINMAAAPQPQPQPKPQPPVISTNGLLGQLSTSQAASQVDHCSANLKRRKQEGRFPSA